MLENLSGEIIEICGPPNTGKTNLALSLVQEIQQREGVVVYVDLDRKITSDRLDQYEINKDELIIVHVDNVKQCELIVPTLIQKEVSLIVIDSVGQFPQISRLIISVVNKLYKHGTNLVIVNQLRFNGEKEKPMWNKTMRTYAAVRIQTDTDGYYKSGR